MMRRLLLVALVVLLLAPASVAQTPVPASPARWATDTAGLISPAALAEVDRQLEEFERTTGNQVLVYIGTTTGDVPIEDWSIKAFEQWKVGRTGLDNGLIFLVFAADRRARIEVGYGLEEKVPDVIASRILNDVVFPKIRAGDNDGAILTGVNALKLAIAGDPSAVGTATETSPGADAYDAARPRRPMGFMEKVIAGLLVVGFLILLVTNPQLALYLLFSILSSGGGGGGRSSGGGGFSGGGGRGGGGGASGSW